MEKDIKLECWSDIEIRLVVAKADGERERHGLSIWGWQIKTITFRGVAQQSPTAQHREL